VALDARTGERSGTANRHHDLWDYDLSRPQRYSIFTATGVIPHRTQITKMGLFRV
jgi:glucose dehydrogenase